MSRQRDKGAGGLKSGERVDGDLKEYIKQLEFMQFHNNKYRAVCEFHYIVHS